MNEYLQAIINRLKEIAESDERILAIVWYGSSKENSDDPSKFNDVDIIVIMKDYDDIQEFKKDRNEVFKKIVEDSIINNNIKALGKYLDLYVCTSRFYRLTRNPTINYSKVFGELIFCRDEKLLNYINNIRNSLANNVSVKELYRVKTKYKIKRIRTLVYKDIK